MSQDIFMKPVPGPFRRTQYGFAGGPHNSPQNRGSTTLVPIDPEMQPVIDSIMAERDAERARKEIEMNTPENRQKAAEAEAAEREDRRIDFHYHRAMPTCLDEGWMYLAGERTDQELRVYTTDYSRRRFWGIKPAGMRMFDFWAQTDPEVTRADDNIAITWADPLIPPPISAYHQETPVIWAGQGVNPDSIPSNPPSPKVSPHSKAKRISRRQDSPAINPTHRVRKTPQPSRKSNKKKARESLADRLDAALSRSEDQIPDEEEAAPVSERTSRSKRHLNTPNAPPEPAPSKKEPPKRRQHHPANETNPVLENDTLPPSKRPRHNPANEPNPIVPENDIPPVPKRPRGRPPKPKPASNNEDTLLPKRPRGRPPGKGKGPAVKGNARVTKPAPAPSNHQMRTRAKGAAKFLELP